MHRRLLTGFAPCAPHATPAVPFSANRQDLPPKSRATVTRTFSPLTSSTSSPSLLHPSAVVFLHPLQTTRHLEITALDSLQTPSSPFFLVNRSVPSHIVHFSLIFPNSSAPPSLPLPPSPSLSLPPSPSSPLHPMDYMDFTRQNLRGLPPLLPLTFQVSPTLQSPLLSVPAASVARGSDLKRPDSRRGKRVFRRRRDGGCDCASDHVTSGAYPPGYGARGQDTALLFGSFDGVSSSSSPRTPPPQRTSRRPGQLQQPRRPSLYNPESCSDAEPLARDARCDFLSKFLRPFSPQGERKMQQQQQQQQPSPSSSAAASPWPSPSSSPRTSPRTSPSETSPQSTSPRSTSPWQSSPTPAAAHQQEEEWPAEWPAQSNPNAEGEGFEAWAKLPSLMVKSRW